MNRTEGKWFVRQYPRSRTNNLTKTQVTFIRTAPWVGMPVKGAVVINLNQQALFQSPSIRLVRPGEEIWMVSPDGSLACNITTGLEVPDQEFAVVRNKLGSGSAAFTDRFRNTEYSFTAVTSPYTGWKYVNIIPTVSLYKSGKAIQSFMIFLIVFSIGIAGLFAFFIALKIYSPIYSLVQLVNNKKGDWGGSLPERENSELTILFSAFQLLKEKGAEMENQLRENWPVLQQSFLQQLIHEKPLHHEERFAKFAYYRLPVTPFGFFVCVLRIDNYSTYVEKYSSFDQSLIRYFIAKLGCEIAGNTFQIYPLHTESRDVILIGNPEVSLSDEHFHRMAEETGERIAESIKQYLDLTVSIGIGDLRKSAGSISETYQEAMDALERRAFKGLGLVTPCWLLDGRGPADDKFFRRLGELKRDILLQIRTEDPNCLEEELVKLQDAAASAEGLPFPLIQHAFFQLVVEVFQRAAELGLASQSEHELAGLQERMLWLETVATVVHFTQAYIRTTNNRFHTEKTGESASVAKQILDYTHINFDKEISLGGIADKLKLDPSYVSRLFRQEVSITFTDYVIALRLAKAKELLQHSTLTVKDIGAMVGYANQRSFNRIFKKYEGVTPGEYREIHAPSKLDGDEIY
ncbi:MAG: transcriptional regulator, AraC family, partial [Paenibacillus sp.]|jgi:AraC-like DNA-binding protein|nr:transcriptional regulator, AraC family [Paenibacillus sp.]